MRSDFASSYFDPCNGAPRIEECTRRGRAPRELDDLPDREGIAASRRRGWNRVERIHVQHGMISRWLSSRVGRPWDAVWSEVCRANDARTVPGKRVREDVLREVDRGFKPTGSWANPFLVDASGILCEAPRTPRWRCNRNPKRVDESRRILSKSLELRRIDGSWYEVEFVPMPPPVFSDRFDADGDRVCIDPGGGYDALLQQRVQGGGASLRLAVSKKALSSRALRRHGISNNVDSDGNAVEPPRDRARP